LKSKNIIIKIMCVALIFVLLLFGGVSCKRKEERPASPDTKEKIPKELMSMYEKTENIFEEVEKFQEEMKKPDTAGQEQGKEEDTGKPQEQQGEEQQQQEKSPMDKKQEKMKQTFEKIDKMIKEIHTNWNSYEVKAMDDNANDMDISYFENTLNRLTVVSENKNPLDVLTQTNKLALHMADFFDLYKGDTEADIIRIKYHIRQIYLYGQQEEWNKAEQQSIEIDPLFIRISHKVKSGKESKELLEKLRLSLEDVKNVITVQNLELMNIKRDIVLKNLDEIKETAM